MGYNKRSNNEFSEKLARGQMFEHYIEDWLKKDNWGTYPKNLSALTGPPRISFKSFSLTLPDIECCKNGRFLFVECKAKERMKLHPATGFATRLFNDYKAIETQTGHKIFFIFREKLNGKMIHYGNLLENMEKNVYRHMILQGQEHILFRVPEAFYGFRIHESFDNVLKLADNQAPCNWEYNGII